MHIGYTTCLYRANEIAASAGHKTISGSHVLKALESVDMEDMVPRLTEELKGILFDQWQ
jgi:hypothetical protein